MEKQKWQVYLNLSDGSYPYTYIWADVCVKSGETYVVADGVVIDFGNEILALSKVD